MGVPKEQLGIYHFSGDRYLKSEYSFCFLKILILQQNTNEFRIHVMPKEDGHSTSPIEPHERCCYRHATAEGARSTKDNVEKLDSMISLTPLYSSWVG